METQVTTMNLSTAQLCLLRCFLKNGVCCELIDIFLTRCGATPEEWTAIQQTKLVRKSNLRSGSRFVFTKEGKREYNKQKQGRYF